MIIGWAIIGGLFLGSKVSSSGSVDPRSTSVAELRRKAEEHSAALLKSFEESLFGRHCFLRPLEGEGEKDQ